MTCRNRRFGVLLCTFCLVAGGLNSRAAEAGWRDCWNRFWSRNDGPASAANTARHSVASDRGKSDRTKSERTKSLGKAASMKKASPRRAQSPATATTKVPSRIVHWAKARPGPAYGIDRRPLARLRHNAQSPVVIFLHGLNSRPEDLRALLSSAQAAGHLCTTFRYPNDQGLQASARFLARELSGLGSHVGSIQLVCHSMGGLIARAVIEDAALDPGTVSRIVMVAPPNHGSNLARYACGLDLYEYATSRTRRRESGFFAGAVHDGCSEATRDLQPGSRFLTRLNGRPRNSDVAYTIVAGTDGPLEANYAVSVGGLLLQHRDRCGWLECMERSFRKHVTSNEELFDGIGDGVVSVNRAQLSGVSDFVLAQISHGEILETPATAESRRVHQLVVSRLSRR